MTTNNFECSKKKTSKLKHSKYNEIINKYICIIPIYNYYTYIVIHNKVNQNISV